MVWLTPVPVPGETMTSMKSFSHKVTVSLGCGPVFCLYCPSSYLSFLLTNQNSSGSVMPHPPRLRRIVLPFGPWFDLRKLGEHLWGYDHGQAPGLVLRADSAEQEDKSRQRG